jgi:hypothetical protein
MRFRDLFRIGPVKLTDDDSRLVPEPLPDATFAKERMEQRRLAKQKRVNSRPIYKGIF